MKKWIGIMLAVWLLVCSSCVLAAEDFTLRSGVKYGMTEEQIMQLELEAGAAQKVTGTDEIVFKNSKELTLAGRNHVNIVYGYDDAGHMNQLVYCFDFSPADDYAAISSALVKKYGETEYSSETGMKLPAIDSVIEDVDARIEALQNVHTIGFASQFGFECSKSYSHRTDLRKFELIQYNQWLIPYGDTHIMIEHSRVRDKFAKESFSMASHTERIIYTLLSEEQNKEMMSQMEKAYSDL